MRPVPTASFWWDGEKIAECYKFESKYTKNKEEVTLCGQFITDSKVTSAKGHRYDRYLPFVFPLGVLCRCSAAGQG